MTEMIPKEHSYWIADALNMHLRVTARTVKGAGTLMVPMVPTMRLSCPMKIVAAVHKKKPSQSAVVVHVRGDLYLLVAFLGLDVPAYIMMIDGSKVSRKMPEIFKAVKTFPEALSRVHSGVVRTWECDPAEATWRKQIDPDSVG